MQNVISDNRRSVIDLSMIIITFMLTALIFVFMYNYDNKYTVKGPQALNGVLILDEQALESFPVLFLINGWEYYGGRLLTPEDFEHNAPLPDQYIFIGQYGGFEAGNLSAPPHGSASYRMNIIIPNETRTYMLELPEIFSAYRIYINGKEAAAMGSPEPTAYQPKMGNKTLSIEAYKSIEILISVSDFSHLYSGVVYPPAFGVPDNILALLNARLVFRSALCAVAVTIGILSIAIGFLSRKNVPAVLYGLMCLFFVGYVCYPITRTFTQGYFLLYAAETLSFYAMLVVVIMLQTKTGGTENRHSRYFVFFGVAVCLFSVIMVFLYPYGNLKLMAFFSRLIDAYKWVSAGFITYTAVKTVMYQTVRTKALLGGIIIFDCGLIMDRVLPLHEPIVTGWFPELASFGLVLSIGLVISKEVAARYKENVILQERTRSMERLSDMQQTFIPLLKRKIEGAETARHDLRHHFVMINGFINNRQYEKLQSYITQYQDLIRFDEPIRYAQNDVANVLAYHYTRLAGEYGIELTLKFELDVDIKIADADLCSLLSNLLENGIEACLRQKSGKRFITFAARQKKSLLAIKMENSSSDNGNKNDSIFISSKASNRKGYGLESIKAVTNKYAGNTDFRYDDVTQVFHSIVMLKLY